jgi:hypothetical protein
MLKQKENFGMSNDPKGFGENPQKPLAADEDNDDEAIDESIWGPQKVLTAEEQADYDAWFRLKISRSMARIADGTAVFHKHEDVMARVRARLDRRIAEAAKRAD